MQTRRDQVQAHRFAQARMQSALLTGEPDRPESPLRRPGVATFAGVMIAVLVASGFGIFGLMRPANKTGWDAPGVLVVERETGTRFVYDTRDQALHPVLNYTSARLILNNKQVTVREFAHASLAGVRRGAPRGLNGLPDALPPAAGLVRGAWSVCSIAGQAGAAASLSVSIGSQPAGRRVSGESGLIVRSADGKTYLIWNDTRLLIPKPEVVVSALGLDGRPPLAVSSAWLNSVVPGPDLVPPLPLDIGSQVAYKVGTQQVYLGQVFKVAVEGGLDASYYVVLRDGLAKITNVTLLLLLGDPNLKYAYGMKTPRPYTAPSADVNAAPRSATKVDVEGFPRDIPKLVEAPVDEHGQPLAPVLCAAYTDLTGNSVGTTVSLGSSVPGGGSAVAPGQSVQVHVPPGTACLARLLPHPGQPSDAVFLVTDLGAKYAVPPGRVQEVLGYGGVDAVPVPKGILDLVPDGPTLDSARANTDLPVTKATPTSNS